MSGALRVLPTLAGLVLAAGCASAPPTPAPTEIVETPASYTAASSTAHTAAPAPELERWWLEFEDPVLTELIETGLADNLDLAAAAARLDAALAQARIAGADLFPGASASLDSRRNKQNFIGFPIPGSEEEVLSTTATSHGLSLNVSWEPDLWSRIRAGRDAAARDARALAWDLAAARNSLAGQIGKLYFAHAEAVRQVDLDRRTLESRRETAQRMDRRYQRGLASPLELRLAEAQVANVEAALAANRQRAETLTRQLEILLGEYPAGKRVSDGSLPDAPGPAPAGIPARLLLRRPDLRAAEERALAAAERVRQARASLYPSFSLTASGGTSSNELEDLLDGDFSVWTLASNLLQPIFQGGRLRAAVDANEAGHRQILSQWVQQSLGAFAEVESQLVADHWTGERTAALARALEETREAERLATDRYLSGLATYLDLLDSQRQAFSVESQWLAARRQRLDARIDLILALGGGFATGDSPAGPAASDARP